MRDDITETAEAGAPAEWASAESALDASLRLRWLGGSLGFPTIA